MKSQTKKPHILFVITQGSWGGAQRYVYDLARALTDEYMVSVCVGEPKLTQDLQHALIDTPGITVYQSTYLLRSIRFRTDILALFELRSLYKLIKPDIIHLNSTKAGILGSLASAWIRNVSVVYTVHGWIYNEPRSRLSKRLFTLAERITRRFKHAFIVLSQADLRLGKDVLHLPSSVCHLIQNGIDTAVPQPNSVHQDIIHAIQAQQKKGATVFVTIANLYATKGIDILLDAISNIPDTILFHLFLIGTGPLKEFLTSKARTRGINHRVTFVGNLPDAAAILSYAAYTVLSSRKEGLPYVLLESLRAGTPVIATNVGGIPELLSGQSCCQIVPSEDTQALTVALRKACTKKNSQRNTTQLTLPYIYTLSHMSSATKTLYRSLLQH